MSELLKKYESIDQSKLNEATIKILNRVKTLTADFTVDDQKNNKIAEDVLNEIMNKNPDAIKIVKRQPKAKTAVKKTHKAKGTHKATGATTKATTPAKSSENNIMSIAKKIQKSGEAWKDAMERAKQELKDRKEKSVQKQKTELEKLFSLVKTKKELQGITKSDIPRDAVRTAKPRGARVVTKEGTTSNQYGTFSNKLGRKYWETRDRHADRLAPNYPKDMPLLASGGVLPKDVLKEIYEAQEKSTKGGYFPEYESEMNYKLLVFGNNYAIQVERKNSIEFPAHYYIYDANFKYLGSAESINSKSKIDYNKLNKTDFTGTKFVGYKYADGGSFAPSVSDGTAFMDNAYFADGGAIKNLPRNSVSKKVKYWSGNVQTSESDLTDDIDNLGNYMDKIKLWSNPFMDYDSACLGFNFKGTQQQLKEKLMKLSEEMKKYKISGKVQDLYDDNSEDDYEYNNGEDLGWNVLIKDWYTKTYPTDDLGEEIDGGNNFKDVWLALHQGTNVYDVLGVGDSVVRERVFEELSKIFEVDYDYVYQKWLDSDNYANGGGIDGGMNNLTIQDVSFSNGGEIESGKIWDLLSKEQKLNFITKYKPEIEKNLKLNQEIIFKSIKNNSWDSLNENIKNVFKNHSENKNYYFENIGKKVTWENYQGEKIKGEIDGVDFDGNYIVIDDDEYGYNDDVLSPDEVKFRDTSKKKFWLFSNGGGVGQKKYNTQYNVGKAKYVVNYHDGIQKHKDGSNFYDIAIFKNKKDFEAFLTKLSKDGYREMGYNSSFEKGGIFYKEGSNKYGLGNTEIFVQEENDMYCVYDNVYNDENESWDIKRIADFDNMEEAKEFAIEYSKKEYADGGSLPFMTDPNFGNFQNTGAFAEGGSMAHGGKNYRTDYVYAKEFFEEDGLGESYVKNGSFDAEMFKIKMLQRLENRNARPEGMIKLWARNLGMNTSKYIDGEIIEDVEFAKDSTERAKKLFEIHKSSFELGGAFMNTDLAGHTGGGTGGLDAGMPLSGTSGTHYTGLVGETGAMSSGELFMDGGAMMANQQVINDASQPYVITEALGNPAQHLAEGGSIVNQYKGRSPMDIWDNLTQAQRAHFIHDHTDEIAKDKKVEKLTARQIKNGSMNEWILTDDDIRNAFGKHIIMGQYAYGGRTKSRPSMRELYIENIAYLTNTREVGVDDFAKEHNLTDSELSNLMTGIGRKMISQSDFVTALVGDKDNAKQKEVVAFAKSDKAYKMADGGSFAPNVSDGTAFMDNAYFADGGGIMADGRIVLRTFNGVGGNENKTYSLIKDDRDSDGKPYYTLVEKPSGSIMAQGDSFQEVNNVANMFSGSFANGGSFAPNVSDGTAFMDNAYFADGGAINGMLNKKILKLAEKKGLTMDDLGRDEFNKVMTQALVESLTDANFHDEAKQVVVKAEGKTKWSDELYRAESFNPDEKVSSFAREVSRECYWEFYDIINAYFFITKMQGSKVAKYIEDLFFKSKTTKSSSSSKLKKYIDHADIKTVTLKLKGKTVTIAGSDVLNGANLMEDGGDLSKIASYVPKRDVIEVELKDGSKIKPLNGYWVKKGAKPLSSPNATPTSKTDETKAHFQADALGNVFVDSNFVNQSQGNLPNSELKHYGFGEFYLETPDGNIDFIRTSEEIDGFVGRTHKLSGSNELIKKLVDAMKEKGRFESTQTFADGGEVRRFNRHEQMDSQTREEVLDIVSEPELKGSLTNYLYGLYDGYDYSETENFKKEMTKLKSKDSALYDRINDVYKKIDKYKFEKYDDFADGGSTGSGFDPVKVKVVLAVGIDSAIEFYDADYPIRPYQLLERAVRGGYITLDEINERVVDSAMETAQDSEDMEEVGSSDFGAYLHNFLNDAGFKVGYINSRLTREYANGGSFAPNVSDGTAFMDNAYFANGGELADIQKIKKALITKAKSRGLYENFGQKEVRVLEDKYGYTNNVRDFDNWAMNFDLSQMANGGEVGQKKYQVQYSVGKVKYLVTYHDGIQKYKDGSNINYIRTFNNKIDLKDFLTKLSKEGYKEMRYNTAFDNGGMFDDNDGFMKANNENNYRYPNKPVHVDTIDESIDLTDNVGQYPNKVVLRGLDESIDLTGSGIRARMSYNPKDRTPEKMMAVNPRMVVTDMPMTTSKKHKND